MSTDGNRAKLGPCAWVGAARSQPGWRTRRWNRRASARVCFMVRGDDFMHYCV